MEHIQKNWISVATSFRDINLNAAYQIILLKLFLFAFNF